MDGREVRARMKGFTPLMDNLVKELGLITAAVWGRVWRYAQQEDNVCTASTEKIADELGISRRTVIRHLQTLTEKGYLKDHTPNRKNVPHIYSVTNKARVLITVEGVTESHSGVPESPTGVTESHSGMTESHTPGVTESHMKKQVKKEVKREEESRGSDSIPFDFPGNGNGKQKLGQYGGVSVSLADAQSIFIEVTGMMGIPGDAMLALGKIQNIADVHRENTVDYLRPYWERWTKTRGKSGRFYSRTGLGWLDWAIAGELPDNGTGNGKPEPIKVTPGKER